MFTSVEVFPNIHHITDAMGVSFTLIAGSKQALVVDTGYGTEDCAAYVRTLTDRPVRVVLTHGHHDHALGARWFSSVSMCAEDMPVFRQRTARAQREAVAAQAADRNVSVPADFLTAPIPDPDFIPFSEELDGFPLCRMDPGNMEAWIIHVPLHTPGSCIVAVPEYRLLLTGDDWNPCTWMWFAESAGARVWRDTMARVIPALEARMGAAFDTVLCSHQAAPRRASELKEYIAYMTDERLDAAPAVDMNSPIRTREVSCPERGWVLVFDDAKLER